MASDRLTVQHLAEDGSNFLSWCSDIYDLAAEKHDDIPKYIKGTLDPANDTDGHDAAGMRIMRLRMGPINKAIIRHTTSAFEMMSALEDSYLPSGIVAQVTLRQQLSDLRADESTDIPAHCATALNLRSQLADVGAPVPDEQFCKTLLLSLPESYHPFASVFKPEQFAPTAYEAIEDVQHTLTVPGITGTTTTVTPAAGGPAAAPAATGAAAGAAATTTTPGTYTFTTASRVMRYRPAEVTPNSLVRRINEEYRSRAAKQAPSRVLLAQQTPAQPPSGSPGDEYVWRAVPDCYNCGQLGHLSRDCQAPRTEASMRADANANWRQRDGTAYPSARGGYNTRGRGGRPFRGRPGRAIEYKGRLYLVEEQGERVDGNPEVINDVPAELQEQANAVVEDIAALNFGHVWVVHDDAPAAQPLNPAAPPFISTGAYHALIANTESNLLDVPAGSVQEPEDPAAPLHSHAVAMAISADHFFFDSGANVSVVNNRDYFETFIPTPNAFVRGVGTQQIPKLGVGTVVVAAIGTGPSGERRTRHIRLTNVAFIPSAPANLISVSRLTLGGRLVVFGKMNAHVVDRGTGEKIMTGFREGELYHINLVVHTTRALFTCTLNELHAIHGHANFDYLRRMIKEKRITGIHVTDLDAKPPVCSACVRAKHTVRPFPSSSQRDESRMHIGEIVHVDVFGRAPRRAINGEEYFTHFVDRRTRYSVVYGARVQGNQVEHIKWYQAWLMTQFGVRLKCLQVDEGREFLNDVVRAYCNEQGIRIQMTAPYSSSSNGIVERAHLTLLNMARAMLFSSTAPPFLWFEAVLYAAYIKNRLPTRALQYVSPYEAAWGHVPNLAHLRQFGAKMWVHVPKKLRTKLEDRSNEHIFTGFTEESRAYRYYKASTGKILLSRRVIFESNQPAGPMAARVPVEGENADLAEREDPFPLPEQLPGFGQPLDDTAPQSPSALSEELEPEVPAVPAPPPPLPPPPPPADDDESILDSATGYR